MNVRRGEATTAPAEAVASEPIWLQSPLFQHLTRDLRLALQAAMEVRQVAAGDRLALKGEPGTELFLVESGALRVHDGEVTYTILGPGQMAGEIALLDNSPRSASLTATEDGRIACLSQEAFMRILLPNPAALQAIIRMILGRIRTQNEQMAASLRNRNAELERLVQERTEEIEAQSEEIRMQMEMLELTTREKERILTHLQDSIDYAYRLQSGLFPSEAEIAKVCPRYGMLHRPKSVVSGDFYWVAQVGEVRYAAIGDATGHGVPGAMVAVLLMTILNQEVGQMSPTLPDPAALIRRLHERLHGYLRQHLPQAAQDGCELAMLGWSTQYPSDLWLCGASRPAFVYAKGVLLQVLDSGPPIGGGERDRQWSNNLYPLPAVDAVYLFSDGITDQFNDQRPPRKLMRSGLGRWIDEVKDQPLEDQVAYFRAQLDAWQGGQIQLDDISLFVWQNPTRQ